MNGIQSGMGSWFRANNSQDSTNGHSWCGYEYRDYSPVFAPDIFRMANGTSPQWTDPSWPVYAKQWCGLEAKVWNPETDTTIFMFIGDAFDHSWVRSPGSIDIMIKSYSTLLGRVPRDKNDCIMGLQWTLTGARNPQYKFGGPGDVY